MKSLNKIEFFKMDRQKNTVILQGMKNTTRRKKPLEVKMTNKVLRERSNCIVCRSSKSKFLKQKHNNKK